MRRLAVLSLFLLVPGCGGDKSPSGSTPLTSGPAPSGSPASIAGNYAVTFTASSVCTQLPTFARAKTYQATITQSGSSAAANLTGANFTNQAVSANVAGNSAAFIFALGELNTTTLQGYVLGTTGTAQVTSAPSTITGDMNGQIISITASGDQTCNAANHRFTFTRR